MTHYAGKKSMENSLMEGGNTPSCCEGAYVIPTDLFNYCSECGEVVSFEEGEY